MSTIRRTLTWRERHVQLRFERETRAEGSQQKVERQVHVIGAVAEVESRVGRWRRASGAEGRQKEKTGRIKRVEEEARIGVVSLTHNFRKGPLRWRAREKPVDDSAFISFYLRLPALPCSALPSVPRAPRASRGQGTTSSSLLLVFSRALLALPRKGVPSVRGFPHIAVAARTLE